MKTYIIPENFNLYAEIYGISSLQ